MENITTYIPVGQTVKIDRKELEIGLFFKKHKIKIAIGIIVTGLLISYGILITNFIHLIMILN